jgi:peptide/nickel transport system substrate-binding protein
MDTHRSRSRSGRVVLAVAMAAMLPAAFAPAASAQSPSAPAAGTAATCATPGGDLIMARDQEATSLVPWLSTGNQNIFLQEQIYDQLVMQLPGYTDPQPGLAESWDISPDALTYTFHLRDAKFSDGSPVTADDVKFSMDRILDPAVKADWAFLYPNIDSFEVVDPKTVVMHMKAVDASILNSLTVPGGGIISKKAFETMGEEAFGKAPVGSGPFMVVSQTLGQDLKVARNPYYWRTGQPFVDSVDFLTILDSNARTLKIQSGEADIAENIPYDQVDQVNSTQGIKVQVEPKMVGWYLTINQKVKPFDELAVRQAMNYAIDKDAINQAVLAGLGTISNAMMVQNGIFWDPSVKPYPFDLDKAKALMASSSVPNGFSFEVLMGKNNLMAVSAAEIIAAQLAELGITMTISQVDDLFGPVSALQFQAAMWGPVDLTSDSPDDAEIAGIFLGYDPFWQNWFSSWNDPKANDLVKRANSTLDHAERLALYSELQQYAMDQAPWVTLLNAPATNAVSDKVTNFRTLPVGWWRLEDVCLAH